MAMPAMRRVWTTVEVRDLTEESRPWPRYELIDGELLVTPSPGVLHQIAVLELARIISDYVDRHSLGLTLMSPSDLELKTETIMQPDVFVIPASTDTAGPHLEWPDVKALLLAVEVISPSSARNDRVVKRDVYMENGVAEYWIVDLDARVVERWTPTARTPEIVRAHLAWTPTAREALMIDLPLFFAKVTGKRVLR
jgi:Uma2 family endonuclease